MVKCYKYFGGDEHDDPFCLRFGSRFELDMLS